MREEIELEDRPGPEKHNNQLRKRQQRVEGKFARQKRGHGDTRAEHAIQGSALGFIQQRPGRAAGGEEQEHDADGGGIERDHGIALVLSHDRARKDGDGTCE